MFHESPDGGLDEPRRLSEDYLELVRVLESHHENQSNADKTWIHRLLAWADVHHARGVRK